LTRGRGRQHRSPFQQLQQHVGARRLHLELRNSLGEMYVARNAPTPADTNPTLVHGDVMAALRMAELRRAILLAE
jgi:hypothetical protein